MKHYSELKTLRLKAGLTMERLAALLGCHKQQVYNFEHGKASVPIKYVSKLAGALKIGRKELTDFIVGTRVERFLKAGGE